MCNPQTQGMEEYMEEYLCSIRTDPCWDYIPDTFEPWTVDCPILTQEE